MKNSFHKFYVGNFFKGEPTTIFSLKMSCCLQKCNVNSGPYVCIGLTFEQINITQFNLLGPSLEANQFNEK
jgi:hypothetical protein